jgi:hypothetical protein
MPSDIVPDDNNMQKPGEPQAVGGFIQELIVISEAFTAALRQLGKAFPPCPPPEDC